ncbi:MAG: trans-2-enoyl-CoA reductase family protein [Treponema sp.]|jgi:enoyl-[acyl-carrier protein] reductase/trans-2-enoyl-CoA reductase (NAD+)|nr:trans-2-enoyl-CoA reductase family protein [Treponema sp.]
MIINPMIRNNICINSHPAGCARVVRNQIAHVTRHLAEGRDPAAAGTAAPGGSPRLVLVLGCSTGYGLASRIAAAFGYGAATVGVSFEKAGSAAKPGTPGWYNNLAFDGEAARAGLASKTLNGDAFSTEMKAQAAAAIRETAAQAGLAAQVDLAVYSLAAPVRRDPHTGIICRSVIKPIGRPYSGTTLDMMSGALTTASAGPATEEEIAHTVKVMGGEDWELWIEALAAEGLLAPGARTLAYTYLGPELSWGIYKNGTIGRAKEDLERAAGSINASGRARAWVSVNKALVTRASAVIPVISFYVSALFKVMKEKGLHEGCIEQIIRLYRDRLYSAEGVRDPAAVPVDSAGRIRMDDWEMREDVQRETAECMGRVTADNAGTLTDAAGFRHDFLEAHGFDVEGINYDEEADPLGIETAPYKDGDEGWTKN